MAVRYGNPAEVSPPTLRAIFTLSRLTETANEITDYSDNVLKLNPGDLTVSDWFAPSNVQSLDNDDDDLGASGAVLVPGTNLVLTGGKEGVVYLLNTASLGHISSSDAQIPQSFPAADVGIFNMAIWNRSTGPVLYLHGGNSPLAAYPFAGNQFDTTPSSQSSSGYEVPFDGMTVSANGGTPGSGIVWVTTADSYPLPSTGTLHAFNADDLSSELWNSSINIDRDFLGNFTKFANPTVANGKVYVPTVSNALAVYGALGSTGGGAATPVITGLVNAASYSNAGVAPGEIVAIFGQNLGPQTLATGSWDANGNLDSGSPACRSRSTAYPPRCSTPLRFVMAVIVPFEVAAANQADMQVSYDGTPSVVQTFNVGRSCARAFSPTTLPEAGRLPF